MTNADFEEFTTRLRAMFALLSHGRYVPDADAVGLWFRTLEPYPLAAVAAGIDAHVRAPDTGRTLPIPADIIGKIEGMASRDGRPEAEEAWAIALQARDECDTVVWTPEIAEAWGAASRVLDLGDEVGARMAFREIYGRLLEAARRERRPARWQAALGSDPARRADAIQAAAALGRRVDGEAAGVAALPAPREAIPLLTAPPQDVGPASAARLAALQAIRERIAHRADGAQPSADLRAKRRTNTLRELTDFAVREYEAREVV